MIWLARTSLNAAHIAIANKSIMQKLIEQGWEFMDAAYQWVPGGFLSFDDQEDMINSSALWYLIYDGPAPEPEDIDFNRVYCAVAFKSKFGLKAVAFGQQSTKAGKEKLENSPTNKDADFRTRRAAAVKSMFKMVAKKGWAEVSGRPEEMFKSVGAPMIKAQTLIDAGVFKGKSVTVEPDGYHYARLIGGQEHVKVAVGKGFRP